LILSALSPCLTSWHNPDTREITPENDRLQMCMHTSAHMKVHTKRLLII